MAKNLGKVKVEYQSIEDSEREAREHPYTVPIPEGLTEEFYPSKPVTEKQMLRWLTSHVEPYPGYAEEEGAWERAWQEVEIAQLKADGEPVLELDPVHVQAESVAGASHEPAETSEQTNETDQPDQDEDDVDKVIAYNVAHMFDGVFDDQEDAADANSNTSSNGGTNQTSDDNATDTDPADIDFADIDFGDLHLGDDFDPDDYLDDQGGHDSGDFDIEDDSDDDDDDNEDEEEDDYADGLGSNPFATLRAIMDATGEGPIDPDDDLQ